MAFDDCSLLDAHQSGDLMLWRQGLCCKPVTVSGLPICYLCLSHCASSDRFHASIRLFVPSRLPNDIQGITLHYRVWLSFSLELKTCGFYDLDGEERAKSRSSGSTTLSVVDSTILQSLGLNDKAPASSHTNCPAGVWFFFSWSGTALLQPTWETPTQLARLVVVVGRKFSFPENRKAVTLTHVEVFF